MRTIFDPVNLWLGKAPLILAEGNKQPVALDDTLSVLQNSGPVTVTVLANDFDPEGQPLTLVSAFAALGTAVAEADNTVTYTPPPGVSGFDTVVYTIADDLGQTRDGQINVTISEPQLLIDELPDNTIVVTAETGTIDITITSPAVFAGTYQADTADLVSGPVNLAPPVLSGTLAPGEVLTASDGLWIHDTGAGVPTQSWQWQRAGADIPGETAASYTFQASDIGQGISAVETLTDTAGQRSASTEVVSQAFAPSADPALIGWWDATDVSTVIESGGAVSSWLDKANGTALGQAFPGGRPETGTRTLNSLNVLDFNGTSDALFADRSFPASGDIAFHVVFVVDGTTSDFAAVLSVEATNDFQIDANNASQFDGRLNAAGIGNTVNLTGGPFTGAFILSAVFDLSGTGNVDIYIADTLRGSASYTTPIDTTAALHLMTNRSQNAWIDGAVAEVILTGDVSNRSDHHTYLANKWGLT